MVAASTFNPTMKTQILLCILLACSVCVSSEPPEQMQQQQQMESTEPKGQMEPKEQMEPKSQMEPKEQVEPKSQMEPKEQMEPKSQMEPKEQVEPKSQMEPKEQVEPKSQMEPKEQTEPKAQTEPNSQMEPKGQTEPKAQTEPKEQAEPKQQADSKEPERKMEKSPEQIEGEKAVIQTITNGAPYVYDDEQKPVAVDMGMSKQESMEETEKDLPNRVTFHLFTKSNPQAGQVLRRNDVIGLKRSHFSTKRPTVFITHGWQNSHDNPICIQMRDAYLQTGDYNVILVDWSKISKGPYPYASDRVPMVSKYVASMCSFLEEQGMSGSQLTVVGHSLGGHIAGLSSYYAKQKAKHIVSLDPALPRFEKAGVGQRVSRECGKHVTVIHSSAGLLGYNSSIGHADFYPNGGTVQIGCGTDYLAACAHYRSAFYFAESIVSKKGFWGAQCNSYKSYKTGECNSNPVVLMEGPKPNLEVKGDYYFDTNDRYPFARGKVLPV